MKFKSKIYLLFFLLLSCNSNNKIDLVVYPEYCGGCISRNFSAIKANSLEYKFEVYFDTTDVFLTEEARKNNLDYTHINGSEIRSIYGDYANIVLFSPRMNPIEIKTNETIKKGHHF